MQKAFKTFGPIDAKSTWRDPLLRWVVVLPVVIALAARWFLPELLSRAGTSLGLDVMPFYPPLMSYLLLTLVPVLVGFVIGFLLLDQRDDRTLSALRVSPLPLEAYVAYRLALPTAASVLATVIAFPLAGLVEIGALPLLVATLVASLQAPLFALTLAAFAENKVQGFALMKASGVFMVPPAIAYFVHLYQPGSIWAWLLFLVPTVWPARTFWALLDGDPNAWGYAIGSVIVLGGLTALLSKRVSRR